MTWMKSCLLLAVFAFVLLAALHPAALAQQGSAPSQTSARAASQPNDTVSAAPSTGKVVTQYAPSQENYQKAVTYSGQRYRHYFVNALYGWLVLLVVLRWRAGTKYRDWAERLSSRRLVQVIIYAPLLLLTVAALGLPTDLWDQSLQRRFGLSVQGWGSWFVDWATNQIVTLVVGTVLVWILYGVIRRSTRRWWLYFWMASIPVLLALFFLQPVVIDPLFFEFTPLQSSHPDLVAAMEHGGASRWDGDSAGPHVRDERQFEDDRAQRVCHRLWSLEACSSVGHDHRKGHRAGNVIRVWP